MRNIKKLFIISSAVVVLIVIVVASLYNMFAPKKNANILIINDSGKKNMIYIADDPNASFAQSILNGINLSNNGIEIKKVNKEDYLSDEEVESALFVAQTYTGEIVKASSEKLGQVITYNSSNGFSDGSPQETWYDPLFTSSSIDRLYIASVNLFLSDDHEEQMINNNYESIKDKLEKVENNIQNDLLKTVQGGRAVSLVDGVSYFYEYMGISTKKYPDQNIDFLFIEKGKNYSGEEKDYIDKIRDDQTPIIEVDSPNSETDLIAYYESLSQNISDNVIPHEY